MKRILRSLQFLAVFSVFNPVSAHDGTSYQAPKATVAPTIDGIGDEAVWATAQWKDANYVYLGSATSSNDYSARFKVVWDENKIYILSEVTDDVLNDNYGDPLDRYWEDDCWELLIDEDNSGGNHNDNWNQYNAFAYHISTLLDVVDTDNTGSPRLFDSHVDVQMTANGNVYTWEGAFDIYDDTFDHNLTTNVPVTLFAGKVIGLGVAYCDNDGAASRDNFFGSMIIEGADKNVAYLTADVFGDVELVDVVAPQFTHIQVTSITNNPTVMTMSPDGRIFYAEQLGVIRVVEDDVLNPTPVADLTSKVNTCCDAWSERGLIGMTLDPDFANNGHMFIFYTTDDGGYMHNRISRITLSGNEMVPGSEVIIKELDALSTATNHNGGALHFLPDGTLMIAAGENATPTNAQDLSNTHGNMLRINPDGSIPADNPYATDPNDATKMIWANGFRNPFTFDVSSTGKIYVNDVGQDSWEEINDVTASGGNYGWPSEEGVANNPSYVDPVYAYNHNGDASTTGCAITGGVFYEPTVSNYPAAYWNKYFFMDYCGNWINVFDPETETFMEVFDDQIATAPVAIDMQPTTGNLYYLVRGSFDGSGGAALYKITYSGNVEPEVVKQPESQSIAESQPVTFTVQATGAQPLSYQWYFDGNPINGAESTSYTIPAVVPANDGDYTVVVTNDFGTATSDVAVLTVTEFNSKPVATITSPADGITFKAGDSFTFVGEATDAEDGTLGAASMTWRLDLHHNTHVHDGIPQTGSATFDYTIPTTGHTETNIWYRIYLFAEDSKGLKDTTYVEIFPELVDINFQSQPSGLEVTIEGQPRTTPATEPSVKGVVRSIGTTSPQLLNGSSWKFIGWKYNNEPMVFDYPTADIDTTFIAMFDELPIAVESIGALKDAYVQYAVWDGAYQTTNYNTDQLIVKDYASDPDRETYIAFDLSQLSGAANDIVSVQLKLTGLMSLDGGTLQPITINAYESSNTTWEENGITWDNKPGTEATIVATEVIDVVEEKEYFWDITSFVQSKITNNEDVISLTLISETDVIIRSIFNSSEAASGQPELIVEYASSSCTETEWFADPDGDGFGDPTISVMACNQPDGYVATAGDPCSPAPTISSLIGADVCAGESISLTASVVNSSGFEGTWTGPGITNPTPGSSETIDGLSPGNYTYTYTLSKATCSDVTSTVDVTVISLPSFTVTNPVAQCEGTVDLASTVSSLSSANASLLYYDAPAGVSQITNPVSVSGTYYVKAVSQEGCSSSLQAVEVTIDIMPDLVVNDPAAACVPNTVDITTIWSDNATTGSTVTYYDASPASPANAINNADAISESGTYTILAVNGSCTDEALVNVTIVIPSSADVVGYTDGDTHTNISLNNTSSFSAADPGNGYSGSWTLDPISSTATMTPNGLNTTVSNLEHQMPVELCWTVQDDQAVCPSSAECIAIEFYNESQIVSAGEDVYACTSSGCTPLSGTIVGPVSNTATWTTTGSGSFTPSANELNAQYCPTVDDNALGQVTLTLTQENGYADEVEFFIRVCTSIDGIEDAESTTVYPNPFENSVTIKHKGAFTVNAYDVAGVLVGNGAFEDKAQLGVDWTPGIYLLNVSTASGNEVIKVTKQ